MIFIVGNKYNVPIVTIIKSDGGVGRFVVHDNLHSDKENGQPQKHYHVDTRFDQDDYVLRIDEDKVFKKTYEVRECVKKFSSLPTPVDLLINCKFKNRRIVNGHCPHKGYDLRSVLPHNGEIYCPLHGLRFDAETGEMSQIHQKFFDRKIMMDKIFPEFSLKDRNLGVSLGYDFPYISPTMKNYEEKKQELLELRKEREMKFIK